MQDKKQQLELDMEQQTGSKSGKEYVKAVFCHPAYLSYMQCAVLCLVAQLYSTLCNSMESTSCEMLGWMNHKLESRLLGEISTASDTQIPLDKK